MWTKSFRCSFRVGRKVLLVVRFEQRIKVGLTTLLSAWVRAYMTLSLEPEQSGSFFRLSLFARFPKLCRKLCRNTLLRTGKSGLRTENTLNVRQSFRRRIRQRSKFHRVARKRSLQQASDLKTNGSSSFWACGYRSICWSRLAQPRRRPKAVSQRWATV